MLLKLLVGVLANRVLRAELLEAAEDVPREEPPNDPCRDDDEVALWVREDVEVRLADLVGDFHFGAL